MGNQLKKEYDVNLDNQCGSGGLGLCWKLYIATDLKTKEEVTIFTFSKKELPKPLRKDGDRYINLLKKEVERGYKFKHPNCLRVIKPIKEFRGELAFVTERVMCSLSNILGDTTQISETTFNLPQKIINFKFGALQLRSGLAQLCDAALFMHNDAHMAHGFIDPSNIYITQTGDWKLFGFQFAEHVATENDESHLEWDFTNTKELPYYPPFTCLAPEIMISNILTVKSDVFSIGRLSYILHRFQSGIRRENTMKSADEYRRFINNLNIANTPHLKHMNRGRGIPFEGIPKILVETLKKTLTTDEKLRCKVNDIINCKYLNDMIVRVIRYLEKLLEKEQDGKIKFLKKLPEVISQFDKPTLIHKVIPPLMIQLQDERMVSNVLPSLIKITELLDGNEYQELIEPILQRYFISTDLPQVFYVLIDNVVLLCSKSGINSRRDQLMPMILKGLSIRNVAIQTNVLKNIPMIVDKQYIEWRDLKTKILPKLTEICHLSVPQNHKVTPLRVNVLMCLAKIFKKFDTDTIIKVILNECVWSIVNKTKETAILMSVLGVCDAIAKHVNPMIIACEILPHIIPLLMEENLNLKQYNTFIKCIRYMIDKIDRYKVNALNRGKDNKDKVVKSFKETPIASSMNDILEKEFDPNKTGEKHQKMDDPFAPKTNDITKVSLIVNNVVNEDIYDDYHDEKKDNDNGNDKDKDNADEKRENNHGFVAMTETYKNDDLGGKIGDDNSGFCGFNASPREEAPPQKKKRENVNVTVPPVYGTKSAVIERSNDKTESFGWGNNDNNEEENNLFAKTDINSTNNNTFNTNKSNNPFTVTPFVGTDKDNKNNNKPKRRVRSKGKIKKNTSSTSGSGFVGFGSGSNTLTTSNTNASGTGVTSAFGFMNDDNDTTCTINNTNNANNTNTNVNSRFNNNDQPAMFSSRVDNEDMFGGMKTNFSKDEDPFAGLGHNTQSSKKIQSSKNIQNNNNNKGFNSNNASNKDESGFEFMNPSENNNNNTAQMFQGFNNSNNNVKKQSNNNSNDPFAGLF